MAVELTNITFDASDPGRLAAFWAAVTGRQVAESKADVAILTSATESRAPAVSQGPRGENRRKTGCISTFTRTDRAAEVTRILWARRDGARHPPRLRPDLDGHDNPEGNEFCIVQA